VTRAGLGATLLLFLGLIAACEEERASSPPPVDFATDIAPLFAARCASCHSGPDAKGGYRTDRYLAAIACLPNGTPATLPNDQGAPLARAIGDETHRNVLDDRERAYVRAWISGGAPAFAGSVHAPTIVDPRSPAFHGRALRAARYAPMVDPADPAACGRCHDGAPSRPSGVTLPAPGATACTSCHDRPGGVFACTTCHGAGEEPAPPRDACFHADDAGRAGAHAAHRKPFGSVAKLPCATCHPSPTASDDAPLPSPAALLSGYHADGALEVIFDATRAGASASYDRASGACAVACHDRGGAAPRPKWEAPAAGSTPSCGSCHGAPPASHPPGPCSSCHQEANDTGTALKPGPLHMNGRVDLGDGSGTCGACHGDGTSPWPKTGAHAKHASPSLTTPVACESCHRVPGDVHDQNHLDGIVEVVLGGRARDRSRLPSYGAGACADVACHGAGLYDAPAAAPRWDDPTGAASRCGACHGVPPTQHTASASCERSTCHGPAFGREADGSPRVTDLGRATHINGRIDVVPTP